MHIGKGNIQNLSGGKIIHLEVNRGRIQQHESKVKRNTFDLIGLWKEVIIHLSLCINSYPSHQFFPTYYFHNLGWCAWGYLHQYTTPNCDKEQSSHLSKVYFVFISWSNKDQQSRFISFYLEYLFKQSLPPPLTVGAALQPGIAIVCVVLLFLLPTIITNR